MWPSNEPRNEPSDNPLWQLSESNLDMDGCMDEMDGCNADDKWEAAAEDDVSQAAAAAPPSPADEAPEAPILGQCHLCSFPISQEDLDNDDANVAINGFECADSKSCRQYKVIYCAITIHIRIYIYIAHTMHLHY